jgi:hypothetical protein
MPEGRLRDRVNSAAVVSDGIPSPRASSGSAQSRSVRPMAARAKSGDQYSSPIWVRVREGGR